MTDILNFLTGDKLIKLADGKFSFGIPLDLPLFIVGVILVLTLSWIIYHRTTAEVSIALKILLVGLRSGILIILLLCLLQPKLSISRIIPQESYLAVLLDNSRSMSIRDMEDHQSRAEVMSNLVFSSNGMLSLLEKDFRVRVFAFDMDAHRISTAEDLTFTGSKTVLSQSLSDGMEALQGFPLSGVILISDGGDNSRIDPLRTAAIFKSSNIPVFTLGVGKERLPKDLEIMRIHAAKTVMEGSIFDVDVLLRNEGFEDHEIELQVVEGGFPPDRFRGRDGQSTKTTEERIVLSKTIKLKKSGRVTRHTLQLTPERQGNLIYSLSVSLQEDELVSENNQRMFLVHNTHQQSDILYVEGHPRHEYKFIQRAIKGDKALRLVTYLQTGPHKFLRQGIKSPEELEMGYPSSVQELFEYEAIIFGDISRAFFTAEQLDMTKEFVSKRGGGFLMLGGTTGFEEKFIETPIAEILPVIQIRQQFLPANLQGPELTSDALVDRPTREKFILRLTPEGEESPIMRLGLEMENRQLWQKMPQLQGVNVTERAKSGATVLAVHPDLSFKDIPLPVIVQERYGRGRTMAIMTASTWRWQMLQPHDDLSHERFWRQLVRWLTKDSPPRLQITLNRDSFSLGERVEVQVQVSDKSYSPVDDATVWLKIKNPEGTIEDLRMQWNIEQEGVYQGSFVVRQEGVHLLDATAIISSRQKEETVLSNRPLSFLVTPSNLEFSNPGMDVDLLQKIAETSGGKFFSWQDQDAMLEAIKHTQNSYTVEMEEDLWDMPLVLILLFVFFTIEWISRRRKGMS